MPEDIQVSEEESYDAFMADISDEYVVAVNPRVHTSEDGSKFLTADIKNNTDKTISNIVITFAVWDENGNCMALCTKENPENTQNAQKLYHSSTISVEPNSLRQATTGMSLSEKSYNIAYVTAFVSGYYIDGVAFEDERFSSLYNTWKETFLDIPLKEWQYKDMTNFYEGQKEEIDSTIAN